MNMTPGGFQRAQPHVCGRPCKKIFAAAGGDRARARSQYGLTRSFPIPLWTVCEGRPPKPKRYVRSAGDRWANIYLRLLRSFALRRRPAPPSFGSINSIPAASKALFTTANVARLWRKSKCECRRNGRLDVERCGHPWDGRVPHQALDIFDSSPGVALVLRARGSLSAVILPDIPAYWSRYAYDGYPYPVSYDGWK